MDLQTTIYIFVGLSFALYLGIAVWARAGSTSEFYAAGGSVHPITNGMATAADWMSAASFISMAGLIANMGYGGGLFLMGWTGGYVLLAMLLAPYLRKFGKFTVPEFIGDRFYSKMARNVAVLCLLIASLTSSPILVASGAVMQFLPWLLFGHRAVPKVVEYLGKILPMAVMVSLLVYCLRGMQFTSAGAWVPQVIAVGVTAGLHWWRRNTLLSIAAGTVCYMLLVQLVF